MKTRCHILVLFFGLFVSVRAQNLVPNPDFETFVECPDTSFLSMYQKLDSTWFEFNSADYFNACDTSAYYGVPMNFIGGYQYPRSGNAYVGLTPFRPTMFGREYIEVELITPLVASQKYYVQYFVNLSGPYKVAIENMGALFTDTLFDPFPPPTYDWVTGTPQIENQPGNMLSDTTGWMEVVDSFVAVGGERFMSIGNFRDDASTVYQNFYTGTGWEAAYYYIDDVYVGATPPVGIDEESTEDLVTVFPNPNAGIVHFQFKQPISDNAAIKIYDLTGRVVYQQYLANGTQTTSIDASKLSPGIYAYEIVVSDKRVKQDKITIVKY